MTELMANEYLRQLYDDLAEDGYCKIAGAISSEAAASALQCVKELVQSEGEVSYQHVPKLNRDQSMVYNLQNKDLGLLKLLFSVPAVQQLLMSCLNDPWYRNIPDSSPNYILRSYLARSSRDELPLHIDSFIPYQGDHPLAVQIAIVLDAMNESNGATVFVPGSHKSGQYATQEARSSAVAINAQPGDIVLWDSRLWHGTTRNNSDSSRWLLIATYTRWWVKQSFDIPSALPAAVFDQLTDEEKAVMGFCSVPYPDEYHGIDMKRGYDQMSSIQQPTD